MGAEESRGCEVGQEDFPVQQLGFMEQALKSEEVDASAALMPRTGSAGIRFGTILRFQPKSPLPVAALRPATLDLASIHRCTGEKMGLCS